MKLAVTKFWSVSAKSSAWLLGAITLCANLACSSDGSTGGSAGAAPTTGGTTGHAGAATAGSTVGGGGTAGSATSGGAGSGGTAGAATTAGSGGVGGFAGTPAKAGAGGASAGTGGASAGTGGGASAGSTGFDPCPATGDCKVLPLGDSITFGTPTNNGGYRVELFTKAVGDNLHLTFVGTQSNGPAMVAGKAFPKANEGYPGITTANLNSQHIKAGTGSALKDMPHIILLHIGTNNIAQANAFSDLEKIVDDIVAAAPTALLAVAAIIPFNTSVPAYNAKIPDLVKKKADAGKHVIFVDQFKDFPTSELTDGVHPNDTKGYPRMGDKWYAAIKPYLH